MTGFENETKTIKRANFGYRPPGVEPVTFYLWGGSDNYELLEWQKRLKDF